MQVISLEDDKRVDPLVFYHGGHIGDVVYALYTIMKAGGGKLVIGPGQDNRWGAKEIASVVDLCAHQPYVSQVTAQIPKLELHYDCDFWQVQQDDHRKDRRHMR